jgi:polyhydroxyalkanoate synthesis regulator phasin
MESDVLTEMRLATESLDRMGDAQRRFQNVQADETAKLWQEMGELRDEVLALSNRLQSLTIAVTTSPTEVARRGFIRLAEDTDSA